MKLTGRFRFNWERSLPAFASADVEDDHHPRWAKERRYELTWLGYYVSWTRKVDRPVALARSVEPWAWVDSIIHFFRSGF